MILEAVRNSPVGRNLHADIVTNRTREGKRALNGGVARVFANERVSMGTCPRGGV